MIFFRDSKHDGQFSVKIFVKGGAADRCFFQHMLDGGVHISAFKKDFKRRLCDALPRVVTLLLLQAISAHGGGGQIFSPNNYPALASIGKVIWEYNLYAL